MRLKSFILLGGLLNAALLSAADSSLFADDSIILNSPYFNHLHQKSRDTTRPVTVRTVVPDEKKTEEPDPRVRIHQEGILEMTGTSVSPLKINVKVGPVGSVGNLEITQRNETLSRWFFRAENVPEDQNIWDSKGRAVLVPGKVSCQVSHRVSLNNYQQAGLTLGMEVKVPGIDLLGGGLEAGFRKENLRSDYFEGEDICSIGEVLAYTTQGDIERRCKTCLGKVLKTIQQDIQSRLSFLNYYVSTPVCKSDSECYREDGDWTAGRCVLVKDKNQSFFTECRARSTLGAACPGEGSRGLFERKCDKGLKCELITEGGTFGFNQYECRNPKQPHFAGPLRPRDRGSYEEANQQLDLFQIALEKYFKVYGRYPSTQQGLEALGIKPPPSDPFSPFDGRYLYVGDSKGYRLVSVGPDGKANTADDLVIKK